MDYKFLVLDIDGTATNSQKEVTPITREAVIRLQETGIPVAIASGRPTPGVAPIADIFDFEKYGSYTLCYNGAKITNWKTKECVYQKTLPILSLGSLKNLHDHRLGYPFRPSHHGRTGIQTDYHGSLLQTRFLLRLLFRFFLLDGRWLTGKQLQLLRCKFLEEKQLSLGV